VKKGDKGIYKINLKNDCKYFKKRKPIRKKPKPTKETVKKQKKSILRRLLR